MALNAAVLNQLLSDASYGKESLSRVIALLKQEVGGQFMAGNDSLQIFRGTVTALAAGGEIRTNGPIKLFLVHAEQQAGATQDVVIRMFNTSTGSTALTTTAYGTSKEVVAIRVNKTGGSKTVVFLPDSVEFDAAASYAVVQAAALDTAAVAGSAPTVTVLYANA